MDAEDFGLLGENGRSNKEQREKETSLHRENKISHSAESVWLISRFRDVASRLESY